MSTWYAGSTVAFCVITLLLGCPAAWMTGRAIARQWKPIGQLVFYCILLAAAVRFLQYALYGAALFAAPAFAFDLLLLSGSALVGFRLARVRQMVTQYRWLYKRTSVFWWRERTR